MFVVLKWLKETVTPKKGNKKKVTLIKTLHKV